MIRLYDMNNYYRKVLETDFTGRAPRTFMDEMFACPDPVICVWDGPRGSQSRRDIFPGYKVGRTPPPQGIYDGFKFAQEIIGFTPAMQCIVPNFEADDVIAMLARRFASQGQLVAVYSADGDFNQLLPEFPGKIIIGASVKNDIGDPKYTRLFKTLVGDSSDKIPGVPMFGPKSWVKNDPEKLLKATTKWVTTLEVEDRDFAGLDLFPKSRAFIEANAKLLQTYWTIIGFLDVDMDLINQHTTFGTRNYAGGDARLKEFLL